MTEEELRTIVDVGKETGVIESEEHEMINNVFDFGDSTARDVMIPRIDMTFVNVDSLMMNLWRSSVKICIPVFRFMKITQIT